MYKSDGLHQCLLMNYRQHSTVGFLIGASHRTRGHWYTQSSNKKCPENIFEAGYKCVYPNARSIVNKKNN